MLLLLSLLLQNELDYELLTAEDSANVVLENPLDENIIPCFMSLLVQEFVAARSRIRRSFGTIQGLKHHPVVINKIASHIYAKEWK